METFELNLSMKELEKRTHKDYLITKKFLKSDAPEYIALKEADKDALKHLVKAAYILEKINMQIDCHHNLEFKDFLEREIAKGNKQAELTKILFDAQKGINAIDTMSTKINLAKGIKEFPGKGVYPEDLSKEEFHNVLIRMIKEGKIDKVEIVTTRFKNMMSYFVEDWQVLPVVGVVDIHDRISDDVLEPLMEFTPDKHHILQKIVPMYMTNIFYQALLEAQASELASRMTAMSAATTNAEKMIHDLSIEYNKTRQTAITQEIIEVVSGANSQLG